MVSQSVWQETLGCLGAKPVVVEPVACQLSSDAGLLPIREFDEKIGLTGQFADVLVDPRDPTFTRHSFLDMVRSRVYGILADYEDQNDHEYAERAESENRNKELKRGLAGDRLSDHRDMANLFRLSWHTAAHNLSIRLRRAVAAPPPAVGAFYPPHPAPD